MSIFLPLQQWIGNRVCQNQKFGHWCTSMYKLEGCNLWVHWSNWSEGKLSIFFLYKTEFSKCGLMGPSWRNNYCKNLPLWYQGHLFHFKGSVWNLIKKAALKITALSAWVSCLALEISDTVQHFSSRKVSGILSFWITDLVHRFYLSMKSACYGILPTKYMTTSKEGDRFIMATHFQCAGNLGKIICLISANSTRVGVGK